MANFTPQEIEQFLQEFFDVAGTRQYVGARYVPMFGRQGEESIEWDDSAPYEPLTIVTYQGNTYTSRTYVPAMVPIDDESYWALTGPYNAQIDAYREEVRRLGRRVDENADAIVREASNREQAVSAEASARSSADTSITNTMRSDYLPFPTSPDSKYGSAGQVLATKANGSTEWTNPVTPSPEDTATAVSAWLDDHPEATTTVQDGSVTTAKLANGAVTSQKLDQSDGVYPSVVRHNAWQLPFSRTPKSSANCSLTWNGDVLTVTGTPTAAVVQNLLLSQGSLPEGVSVGDSILLPPTGNAGIRMAIFDYVGGNWTNVEYTGQDYTLVHEIPSDSTGMIIRVEVQTTFDGNTYSFVPTATLRGDNVRYPDQWYLYAYDKMSMPSGSLNDAPINACVFLTSGNDYSEMPTDLTGYRSGFLLTFKVAGTIAEQIFIQADSGTIYTRYGAVSLSTWYDWHKITPNALEPYKAAYYSGSLLADAPVNRAYLLIDSGTYQDKPTDLVTGMLITYELFNNWKVQIAMPLDGARIYKRYISSGTASKWQTLNDDPYLAPTGDTTDRTTEIYAKLNTYGECRLGKGTYYVSNLDMPMGSTLRGCGESSVLRLIDGDSKSAVLLNTHTEVRDLAIRGAESGNFNTSATIGTRHGITFTNRSGTNPERAMVSNVFITNMSGGGITCVDTSGDNMRSLSVTNAYIKNCGAGINIPRNSEYHNFTDVKCVECYYGCVNNGGNNTFANCSFTYNIIGALLDATNSHPNSGHGTFVGCNFNHEGTNNDGYAIRMVGIPHGFVVDSCQLWYGKVEFDNCSGIIVSNCLFGGSNNSVTIDDGRLIMLNGCAFQLAQTISITDNTTVKVDNCYLFDGTAVTA